MIWEAAKGCESLAEDCKRAVERLREDGREGSS